MHMHLQNINMHNLEQTIRNNLIDMKKFIYFQKTCILIIILFRFKFYLYE